jgi:hypothetical protein
MSLEANGQGELAQEFEDEAMNSDYKELLTIASKYVDVI